MGTLPSFVFHRVKKSTQVLSSHTAAGKANQRKSASMYCLLSHVVPMARLDLALFGAVLILDSSVRKIMRRMGLHMRWNLRIGHTRGDVIEPHVESLEAFVVGERHVSATYGIDTEHILGQRHSRLRVNVVVPSRLEISGTGERLGELARIAAPPRAVYARSRLLAGGRAVVRDIDRVVLVSGNRFKHVYLSVQDCGVHDSVSGVRIQCQHTQVECAFQCSPRFGVGSLRLQGCCSIA